MPRHSRSFFSLLLTLLVAGSAPVGAESASHWLETSLRFFERGPSAAGVSLSIQSGEGDQAAIVSAGGSVTYGDATHMRVSMWMTLLRTGKPSQELNVLMVADGETLWTEIESPDAGVQVTKESLEQQERGSSSLGGLAPADPLAQFRNAQELFDFEVAEEGAHQVVLRGKLKPGVENQLAQLSEMAGQPATVLLALDPESGAPLRMEVTAGALFRMDLSIEKLTLLDAAVLTDGTFAYQPPAGASLQTSAGSLEREGKRYSGYIDRTGAVVVEPVFQTYSAFSEGLARVETSLGWGRSGFIDKTGRLVIEKKFREVGSFSEGLAYAALTHGKYGYIDSSGVWSIEPRFEKAGDFAEGLAPVILAEACAWIDKKGKNVIGPLRCDEAEPFSGGVAAFRVDRAWGLIDRTGKVVIEPRFRDLRDAADGFVAVREVDAWGFVDLSGRMVVKPRYDQVRDFSEGLAPVLLSGRGWSFIDRTGKVVIEGPFELAGLFREGLAPVQIAGAFGFIDRRGRMVLEPRFTVAGWFTEGLAPAQVDGKAGFIDRSGQFVIEPRFEYVDEFSDGLARFEVTIPLSPLHKEVEDETKWAENEARTIEHFSSDAARVGSFQEQTDRLRIDIVKLQTQVPSTAGTEEFERLLERLAAGSGLEIVLKRLDDVERAPHVEGRLRLVLSGPDETIDSFLRIPRSLERLSSGFQVEKRQRGSATATIGIYWSKPFEEPTPRPCRRFSNRLEPSSSPFEREAVGYLESLCDELDAAAPSRRLSELSKPLMDHLLALSKLSREVESGRVDSEVWEDADYALEELLEKIEERGESPPGGD